MAKYTGSSTKASVRMTLGYCLLLTLTAVARPQEQCLHRGFIFPTASSNTTITIAEGSNIRLPFTLNTAHCPASGNQTYVYVKTPDHQDFCALRLMRGECTSTNNDRCACVDDAEAVLTKTLTKQDSGVWVWRTGDGSARTQMLFDVQEASGLPDLTEVPSSETKPGRDLEHSPKGENAVLVRRPAQQKTPATSLTVRSEKTRGRMRYKPERADEDEKHNHDLNILITGKSLDKEDNHVKSYGGIISASVIVIIAVVGAVLVVYVFKRKRARKERATIIASAAYADVTDEAVMRQRSVARDDEGNSYVPLCLVRHSGEEAPETFINEAYLMTIPRKQHNQEEKVHA